jgi:hypothetical protein
LVTGEAIAAAASAADNDGWKLNGHGIKGLEMAEPLPDVILKPISLTAPEASYGSLAHVP